MFNKDWKIIFSKFKFSNINRDTIIIFNAKDIYRDVLTVDGLFIYSVLSLIKLNEIASS